MAQYSISIYAAGPPNSTSLGNYPLCEIIASPTDRPVITEIGFYGTDQASSSWWVGLGTPAANGIGPQLPPVWGAGAHDPNNGSCGISLTSQWQVPPTSPIKFLRRQSSGATYGSITACVWRFPRGLILAQGSHMVIWGLQPSPLGRGSQADVWVEFDN